MRKIKVGAIQPEILSLPEQYSYLSDDYWNDPDAVIDSHMKKQMAITVDLLERAGSEGCGIVTTCEDISGLASYCTDITEKNIFPEIVEKAEPLLEETLSRISRKFSMYIVGCYFKKRNGNIYNTASIFDRQGQIVSEYRKTHLPVNEKWQCTPGDTINVFDLDFGRVGVCICYDILFPELIRVQALKGAEIIFHPTYGYGWYDAIGEATLRTRANDNGVYIVTSKDYRYNSAGKSSIIDYWGHVLVDAGFCENTIVTKEIDLDVKKTQPDWYINTQISDIAEVTKRLNGERRPELYSLISEMTGESLRVLGRNEKLEIFKRIKSGTCHW